MGFMSISKKYSCHANLAQGGKLREGTKKLQTRNLILKSAVMGCYT